ncbi:MAG: tRNA (guanosine(37)-N1)-methyltransferase TrmD [Bacilli bacterium]
MRFNIVTIFPEVFDSFLNSSIVKKAIDNGNLEVKIYNFRDFSSANNKSVDDTSYGGGAGMVLQVEPIHKCLQSISNPGKIIALTPTGEKFDDQMATTFAKIDEITILCGHYEGFDERVYNYVDLEVSIGDYVLTGGEVAAFVLIDAITRKVEGVIKKASVDNDSFAQGLLDYPVYTKPVEYDGNRVPDVLLSGNHQEIDKYRYEMALEKTLLRRRDLIDKNMINIDQVVLEKIKERNKGEL